MAKAHFIYIHGGPGMNSFGEEDKLRPLFEMRGAEIEFWNESPAASTQNGYRDLIDSIRKRLVELKSNGDRLHVIAHSFGANAVCHLILEDLSLVDQLTLVAPTLHFRNELPRILNIALRDFKVSSVQMARELGDLIEKSQIFFDEPMKKAVSLAAQDPGLFDHYFFNKEMMAKYFESWAKRGGGLDLNSFYRVIEDYAAFPEITSDTNTKLVLPVTLIFGAHDPVVDLKRELETCQNLFSNLTVEEFGSSSHFPHLEEAEKFLTKVLTP